MYYGDELKIYYMFTCVDGKMSKEENRKFAQLCKSQEFGEFYKDDIINECDKLIDKAESKRIEGVIKEIAENIDFIYTDVDKQRILWNVINIAFIDNEIASSEQMVIDFLVNALQIPSEIYDEMFDVAQTMLMLVKEEERLKELPEPEDKKIKEIKKKIKHLYKYVKALVEMADVK